MCVFLNSNVFFCLCHNRIEKFRRPGNFFPSGEKNVLVCSSFRLGRLSSFFVGGWGGGKEVNEGQHLPCCFYLRLLLDTLCVIRNFYVNLLVSRRHSQSGGWGARRLMRRPAPTMLFLFAFVIRHVLCQKLCKSVGQSTRSINMLML